MQQIPTWVVITIPAVLIIAFLIHVIRFMRKHKKEREAEEKQNNDEEVLF